MALSAIPTASEVRFTAPAIIAIVDDEASARRMAAKDLFLKTMCPAAAQTIAFSRSNPAFWDEFVDGKLVFDTYSAAAVVACIETRKFLGGQHGIIVLIDEDCVRSANSVGRERMATAAANWKNQGVTTVVLGATLPQLGHFADALDYLCTGYTKDKAETVRFINPGLPRDSTGMYLNLKTYGRDAIKALKGSGKKLLYTCDADSPALVYCVPSELPNDDGSDAAPLSERVDTLRQAKRKPKRKHKLKSAKYATGAVTQS